MTHSVKRTQPLRNKICKLMYMTLMICFILFFAFNCIYWISCISLLHSPKPWQGWIKFLFYCLSFCFSPAKSIQILLTGKQAPCLYLNLWDFSLLLFSYFLSLAAEWRGVSEWLGGSLAASHCYPTRPFHCKLRL